jgi:acyl-CoA synthetase (NDP forming)
VAIADNLGAFTLAEFTPETVAAIGEVLKRARVAEIVSVHNPMDLTPIMADPEYDDLSRLVLEDPNVDLGLMGIVPLTQALNTLAPGTSHHEDLARDDSIVNRYVRLFHATTKPWVAVVDSGALYDPMVQRLEAGRVPVFRSADRALRLLNRWVEATGRG